MEGYPINDTTFAYINDPVTSTNSVGPHMIEQLNCHIHPDAQTTDTPANIVNQLGNELYMDLQGTFTEQISVRNTPVRNTPVGAEPEPESEPSAEPESEPSAEPESEGDAYIQSHLETIKKCMECWESTMNSYKQAHARLCETEEELLSSTEKTQKSLCTIRKFSSFLQGLEEKEHEELQMMMVILSEKLAKKDTTRELKKKYQQDLYIIQMYLHLFVKPINGGNTGNTCSLCLQNPVDTFFNPCGHTGCGECIGKLRGISRNYVMNCPLCRKHVATTHKLYFS